MNTKDSNILNLLNLPIWHLFNKTDDLKTVLASNLFNQVTYTRGDFIIKENQSDRKLYLIIKGIVRSYINHNDTEYTFSFDKEGDYVGCPGSLFSKLPAAMSTVALCNVEVLEIDYNVLDEKKEEPDKRSTLLSFENNIYRKMIAEAGSRNCGDYLLKEPLDQYKDFEEKFKMYMKFISDKHIASFLKVNPVSLSRIKKRLKELDEINKYINI